MPGSQLQDEFPVREIGIVTPGLTAGFWVSRDEVERTSRQLASGLLLPSLTVALDRCDRAYSHTEGMDAGVDLSISDLPSETGYVSSGQERSGSVLKIYDKQSGNEIRACPIEEIGEVVVSREGSVVSSWTINNRDGGVIKCGLPYRSGLSFSRRRDWFMSSTKIGDVLTVDTFVPRSEVALVVVPLSKPGRVQKTEFPITMKEIFRLNGEFGAGLDGFCVTSVERVNRDTIARYDFESVLVAKRSQWLVTESRVCVDGTIVSLAPVLPGQPAVSGSMVLLESETGEGAMAYGAFGDWPIAPSTPAQERAMELLEADLDEHQIWTLRSRSYFDVECELHDYRLWLGNAFNIDVLAKFSGEKVRLCVGRLCATIGAGYPIGDSLLAQKLMLESSESEFWKIANYTPTG